MANILFLFPHPDDEVLFAGGAMLRHQKNKDQTTCILASNGEKSGRSENRSPLTFFIAYYLLGHFRFLIFMQKIIIRILSVFRKPDKELSVIRKNEAKKALGLLGIGEIIFWEIEDMNFSRHKQRLVELIKKHLEQYRPEIIYTFHPNGITDHPDHIALSECLMQALRNSTWKKTTVLGAAMAKSVVKKYNLPFLGVADFAIEKEISLNEKEVGRKQEALNSYASQKYQWELFLKKQPFLIEKEYFSKLDPFQK